MHFSSQLGDLWQRAPLVHQAENFLDPEYEITAIRDVGDWRFSAVVHEKLFLVSELRILMLRAEEPGAIVTQGGDIDNRLKTLLDALSVPKPGQLPELESPPSGPIHCLLEDDNLVTGLSVKVDRLLGSEDASEVLIVIEVDVSATRGTFKNLELSI